MRFQSKLFDELTTRELYEILRARTEIFLMEQGIICRDLDGVDYDALHCFLEEDGQVLAYLRAYRTNQEAIKIGRVLSITHGIGLGTKLLSKAIPTIRAKLSGQVITLHAQKHAQGFYESLGFIVTSPDFLEEGIPHVKMELPK